MANRATARWSSCVSKPAQASLATYSRRSNLHGAAGFSLVELLIVCALISILAAVAISQFTGRDQAGRLAREIAWRVRQRRAAAIRLNALTEPTLLENYRQPPVSIDFGNLSTTRSLRLEGADATSFNPPAETGGTGTWNYVYQGDELRLPPGPGIGLSPSTAWAYSSQL